MLFYSYFCKRLVISSVVLFYTDFLLFRLRCLRHPQAFYYMHIRHVVCGVMSWLYGFIVLLRSCGASLPVLPYVDIPCLVVLHIREVGQLAEDAQGVLYSV